ncbi:MAG: response regulator [Pseudomonadota bacterium]|nr:response regulator [Pseudomonadota bacterium]
MNEKPSVVIADDNEDLANSLALCLEVAGFETSVAYDGLQAVAAARALRPSAVILDLAMPRLDGYAAAQEIRALLGQDVLMIAHTAWGDDASRQRTRDSGFDHHVMKTTDIDVLLHLLAVHKPRFH